MQKMIIKYYDLATTSESKLKATKGRETKLREEMTALRKSCNARIAEKEKIVFEERGWAIDALSKMDQNEILIKLLNNKI